MSRLAVLQAMPTSFIRMKSKDLGLLCKAIIRSLNTNYKYNLISYDKTTRHETQPYPDVAIREGIYNTNSSSFRPIGLHQDV